MISQHAQYLREKAKQFREAATVYRTEISDRLLELAAEFEAKAAELDKEKRT